jgi:hypothetical protein
VHKKNKGKALKRRGGEGETTERLEGEEEAAAERIGGEARSSGGFLGGGGVEGEKSSIERCGVERSSGAAFYRWRGERRSRGRGGGRRAWRRPPLMAAGSVGGRREVEGGPDRWAPPVSGARVRERDGGLAG